ncbi:MAG: 50S ribosomal protein L23 [Rickettsiales bacterium]|nr:50S ribosomal protein L23 [Rickettsiales bacterium]
MMAVKPLSTEKSSKLIETGIYTFIVPVEMRKDVIKKEIESIFGVKIVNVMTLVRPKKYKSFRGVTGEINGRKKVYVKVASGMKIDFDNVVKK